MAHQVFISYSSWDKPVADAVCRELEACGVACWIAPRDITPGSNPQAEKVAAIQGCQIFLLVLSSRSSESHEVEREISTASQLGSQIVPLLIEDPKTIHLGNNLEYHLSNLHWLEIGNKSIREVLADLTRNILRTIQQSEALSSVGQPEQERGKLEQKTALHARESHVSSNKYDVFISYRRETDSQTARLIRSELEQKHYKVFLDVEDLRPGHFDGSLLENIREAPFFILILSPGSLDRCYDKEDWLRREISCALVNKKTIIPIMMPSFTFPPEDQLPGDLHDIHLHHAIHYSHEFFSAMIDKIVSYLRTSS